MTNNYLLSELDINYLLNLPEVMNAKQQIDEKTSGSVYFNVNLPISIKEYLQKELNINITNFDTIPMRWIKGDTLPHIDKGIRSFDKTYLVYLTDSQGDLVIDGESYPINKGSVYIFSEGLSHETIGTGSEPRLLLGPMSEYGFAVGSSISGPGGSTIYFRQTGDLQYSTDNQQSWTNIGNNYPISIYNSNTALGLLKIQFVSNITLDDTGISGIYKYFVCSSSHIQFGSESLNNDGTRPTININVANYDGLIQNGDETNKGNNDIYVYNLIINASGYTTQIGTGWIGRKGFGNGMINNYIINCSSIGNLPTNGAVGSGGIVGAYAGKGGNLYIYGCSSSGTMGQLNGGIVGAYAGQDGGSVICQQCWSDRMISNFAGGIFGDYAGDNGYAEANKCYTTGAIGENAGGIFGRYAGNNGQAIGQNCYSTGSIDADGGGIFGIGAGSNSGASSAINCYSAGSIATVGNGIYGSGKVNGNQSYCYSSNGSINWSNAAANTSLTGTPNPIIGTTWVYDGTNSPYLFNNMGYTPYILTNISATPSLIQMYSATINIGQSTSSAIVMGKSYTILSKSGGDPSSYGTITIDNNTGSISTTSSTKSGTYILYIRNNGSYNITTFSLTVNSLSPSQPPFMMTSLFTNNAQVFYKPHSLASGGVGTVKNCRHKARKT